MSRKITIDLDKLGKDTKTFVLEIEKTLDSLNKEKSLRLSKEIEKLATED